MSAKFDAVPVDDDTNILFQKEIKITDIDALWQQWSVSGFPGESVIFSEDDVKGIPDDDLESLVRSAGFPNSSARSAVTRGGFSGSFAFVNFFFDLIDD